MQPRCDRDREWEGLCKPSPADEGSHCDHEGRGMRQYTETMNERRPDNSDN